MARKWTTYQTGLIEEGKYHDERLRIGGKANKAIFTFLRCFCPPFALSPMSRTNSCGSHDKSIRTCEKTIGAVASLYCHRVSFIVVCDCSIAVPTTTRACEIIWKCAGVADKAAPWRHRKHGTRNFRTQTRACCQTKNGCHVLRSTFSASKGGSLGRRRVESLRRARDIGKAWRHGRWRGSEKVFLSAERRSVFDQTSSVTVGKLEKNLNTLHFN